MSTLRINPTLWLTVWTGLHLSNSFHVLRSERIGSTVTCNIVGIQINHLVLTRHGVVVALETARIRGLMVVLVGVRVLTSRHFSFVVNQMLWCIASRITLVVDIWIWNMTLGDIGEIDCTYVTMTRTSILTTHHDHWIVVIVLLSIMSILSFHVTNLFLILMHLLFLLLL